MKGQPAGMYIFASLRPGGSEQVIAQGLVLLWAKAMTMLTKEWKALPREHCADEADSEGEGLVGERGWSM